jgi:hypothetical protein
MRPSQPGLRSGGRGGSDGGFRTCDAKVEKLNGVPDVAEGLDGEGAPAAPGDDDGAAALIVSVVWIRCVRCVTYVDVVRCAIVGDA